MKTRIGFFALKMELALGERGITGTELAEQLNCSYTHVRKLLLCESLPSKWTLSALCEVLHLNRREAQFLVALDYCRMKFGTAFWECMGWRPENDEFYVLWYFLLPKEREFFLAQLKALVGRRKR
jgi:hypothetical protein